MANCFAGMNSVRVYGDVIKVTFFPIFFRKF